MNNGEQKISSARELVNASEQKILDIEARRTARREKINEARRAQYAIDLEAFDALEEEHGDAVKMLEVTGFVPGLPTLIVIKSPGGTSFYNRYKDQVRKSNNNAQAIGAAQEMLGASCIVYPKPEDKDLRDRMFKEFPGALISAALAAIKLVELQTEDEKKG